MPTCKGCNAEILWVKTKDGKNMPLDPIPFKAAVLTGAPDRRVAENRQRLHTPLGHLPESRSVQKARPDLTNRPTICHPPRSSNQGGNVHEGKHLSRQGRVFRVVFGRDIRRWFKHIEVAERFLTGLRFESDRGVLDKRDYRSDNPLAFNVLADKWLATKSCSKSHLRNLKRWIGLSIEAWGERNVKAIKFAEIEDFINAQPVGNKTKHEMVNCFHQFFAWVRKREGVQPPEMPEYEYTLGWREIIDLESQGAILDEVKRIAPTRIWIGLKWLATYVSIRPAEMREMRERDVNVNGFLVCRPETTKDDKPKTVPMNEDDLEIVRSLPRGLPDLYFFRREAGRGVYGVGEQIGIAAFYRWWKRACRNLGVKGVDMYGGTRHSSASAMAEYFTKEEMREHGTRHGSNKAFERYFQHEAKPSRAIYEQIKKAREFPHGVHSENQVVELNRKK